MMAGKIGGSKIIANTGGNLRIGGDGMTLGGSGRTLHRWEHPASGIEMKLLFYQILCKAGSFYRTQDLRPRKGTTSSLP
jgi:hypothetical protein